MRQIQAGVVNQCLDATEIDVGFAEINLGTAGRMWDKKNQQSGLAQRSTLMFFEPVLSRKRIVFNENRRAPNVVRLSTDWSEKDKMNKLTGFFLNLVGEDKTQENRTKVIQLADQSGKKAQEILRFSIAKALNTSVERIYDAMVENAATLMAKVPDGYVLYRYEGTTRAALIINIEFYGQKFPFIHHSDDGASDPVGLLYSDMEFECLGAFIDYLRQDDNIHFYHAAASYIPASLNGIGFIQAIYNAKQGKVLYYNEQDIRRVCKITVAQLQG